ncbi:right-handed parallel beta-helix repeat-containing protein [Aureimonas leprariae]|uniref:Right-handed parallel beta-helix repeat-containing protein n=1 Tax=Plantimonas leprariae TaxID=2615207 RepID=A0A7V7PQK0_9HYPH|nr:right-handed parallel beta-helix repeat-containing protein [Aureimonas leprariae]KAB0680435.1 right-handed parallel beta-helix repeat-containing protein [Aureimonas leprariae]
MKRPAAAAIWGIGLAVLLVQPVTGTEPVGAPVEPERDSAMPDCATGAPLPPKGTAAERSRPPSRAVFHVSPDGRDTWRGDRAKPNEARTDGPFATIEAARDAARAHGAASTIMVGGGDYYLTKAIVFGPRDAGLVVMAACGETPVLHGGPRVDGWTRRTGSRWTARLPLPAGEVVGDLFVDGALQTEARFPDAPADGDPRKGWLFAAKPRTAADADESNTSFRFHVGDLPPLGDMAGLVVHIVGGFRPGTQWGSDTMPVVSADAATQTIRTRGTGYFFTGEGSRYFLSGAATLLDAPREWRYAAAASQLDYIAPGASFGEETVVAGILPTFFRLNDADDMVVAGLRFVEGSPAGSGKYGTDTRGFGAIRLEHADRVSLLNNTIGNVGVGIHVSESQGVFVAGNEIGPTAGNGIYVGTEYGSFGKSNDAEIVSNRIHDVGRVYFETAGIWFQAADDLRIAHNLIENAAQFGIIGGSLWGQQDAVYRAVIEYNDVRNANQRTADGGAIKMMGEQGDCQNSVIRYNLVTGTNHLMNRADGTFWPSGYEKVGEWPSPVSWAIYTDGRASGIRIEGNVLSRNVAAIGINGGWNNVVTGNVVAHGSGAAFHVDDGTGRGWRPPWARPNRIEDNIVSLDGSGALAASVYAPGNGGDYVRFARNRYDGNLNDRSFLMEPELMPSGLYGSLADFQSAGQDAGSVGGGPASGDP